MHDVIAYNRLELLRLFMAYNYNFQLPVKRWPPIISNCLPTRNDYQQTLVAKTNSNSIQYAPFNVTNQLISNNHHLKYHYPQNEDHHSIVTITQKNPFNMAIDRGHLDMARILAEVECFQAQLYLNGPNPSSSVSSTGAAESTSSVQNYPPIQQHHHYYINSNLTKRYKCLLEVKSLQKWCRKSIRKQLGFSLTKAIPQLPIPVAMKDYLLLRDLDWSNKTMFSSNLGDLAIIVPST